jgi:pimeloyl-ACP methyl ester carboxylesterase
MTQGNFAELNGLKMYYEIHGAGEPLLLLHGGYMTLEALGPILPALARIRQVIAVELEGHGRTADLDRPLSFEQMGDDLAALLQGLGLPGADFVGYSLGGGAALQTAIRHPGLVRKLVVVSAPCRSTGWYPEVHAQMKLMGLEAAKAMQGSPMYQAYLNTAPHPENWERFVVKMGQLIGQDYDWSEGVATIRAPVLIAIGDADSVRTAHGVEFFELLGGGQRDAGWDGSGMPPTARLAILPGTTHYNIFATPLLASVVSSFLEEPMLAAA